jgi:hypothetical protein
MLIAVWKRSGKIPKDLLGHETGEPPELAYLWRWFNELASPITWREIAAWSRVTGIHVERWEGVFLMNLDQAFRG